MKMKDLLTEGWSADEPLKNTPYPLDMWDPHYAEMLKRFDKVKSSSVITAGEAAMLIAADQKMFEAVDDYKQANAPIPTEVEQRLITIIKRVKPISSKTFYRGVDHEDYDDKHIMGLQSWSPNIQTAKMFGRVIYKTLGPVRGFEIGEVYYWHDNLHDTGNGLGDSQAEWLLLPPEKELLEP